MALRVPTKQEVGQRLRWLRRQADLTGKVLAERMGSSDAALVARLEKGIQLNWTWCMKAADAMAGVGQLVDDPHKLFDFLMGIETDPRACLVPHLRLVGEDQPESADSLDLKGGSTGPESLPDAA